MSILHYVKVSDVDYDYCFLDVSRNQNESPFMDIRITDNRKLEFYVYREQSNLSFSVEEWKEIHDKSLSFLKDELENEESFKNWSD